MKKFTLLASLAFLAAASVASAHTEVYSVSLSGPNEAPANSSPGIGTATITFDLDLATMRVQCNFSGLTGNVTASHIHGPTAVPGAGTAGVMTITPSFTGFPTGVTAGTYDHLYDLTASTGTYNPSFVTAQGSISNAMNTLLAAAHDGKAYLNIHTSTFGGGEIRGFLTLIPEPTSLTAVAGAGLLLRRRR